MPISPELSAHQHVLDIDYPLHPDTASSEAVARLVGQILRDIESQPEPVAEFDVLQALTIATAVRMAMADASQRIGVELAVELLDVAADSVPLPAGVTGRSVES